MSGKLNTEDCVLLSGAAQGAESAFGAAAEVSVGAGPPGSSRASRSSVTRSSPARERAS
jgi:hypothetical protein